MALTIAGVFIYIYSYIYMCGKDVYGSPECILMEYIYVDMCVLAVRIRQNL